MLDVLIAVILGIVEGITEWLPISSTGHMILVEQFLHMSTSHEFNSMFRVVIQLGAIMAVEKISEAEEKYNQPVVQNRCGLSAGSCDRAVI